MNISGVRPRAEFYEYKDEAKRKAMAQSGRALRTMDNEFVNMDMERAIHRMQEDYAIHQYQCFVGEKSLLN